MIPTSSAMTEEELRLSTLLLGPWLIGSFLDIFLQGALSSQFIKYFSWHHQDATSTRLAVAGLAVLTYLKSVHSAAVVWVIFVLNFKDLERAISLNYTWWLQTCNILAVSTIGAYVQIFYCHRLWVISKHNVWYVLPAGAVLLFAYLSSCLATYYVASQGITVDHLITMWLAAHLSSVFAGDLMLTISTAYLLLKYRKDVLPHTFGVIRSLVRLTFQTAAPAALCAMVNLVMSQVYQSDATLVPVAINQALPKLYAFSMMWTLNARRSIRANLLQPPSHNPAVSISMRVRPSDLELSTTNPRIEVHKKTSVERHVEPRKSDVEAQRRPNNIPSRSLPF